VSRNPTPLQGKAAVITGGARGIGKATAKALAEAGAGIALFDVVNDVHETAKEIAALGVKAEGFIADVTQADPVRDVMKQVVERFGSLDILVNNAGITRDNLLLRMTDEEWDKVLAINLRGAFVCLRAAARYMIRQRSGRVINIASVVGVIGNPGQCNYSASKAGLIGLTKSAARELASRGVTVNAIAPGYIQTAMTNALTEEQRNAVLATIPLQSLGTPEDVASAVLFLASDDARYVTGHVLHVDGGMAM
jgi:3-oxoacyl-[acyl-carrier protein] reductase